MPAQPGYRDELTSKKGEAAFSQGYPAGRLTCVQKVSDAHRALHLGLA